jgi:hypothetical protein
MAEGFALLIWLLFLVLSIAMVVAQLKLFKISDALQRILAIMEQQQGKQAPRQTAVAATEAPPMVEREMYECTNCRYRVGVERGEPGRCGNCGNKKWDRKMVAVPAPQAN